METFQNQRQEMNLPVTPQQMQQIFQQQLEEFKNQIQSAQTRLDQMKNQPKDLYSALFIANLNCESLKQTLSAGRLKKTIDETELEGIQCLASNVNNGQNGTAFTCLKICAVFGYTEKGLKLIQSGAKVNQQNNQGLTALMFAAMFHSDEFVKMLIQNEADVNLKDRRQLNALMLAALQGHEDIVQILLDHNADVNSKTPNGLDALHIAVEKGFTKIVEMLLSKGVNTSTRSLDGWTPLMRSVRHKDHTITKLLLKTNAGINEKESRGNTALHICGMFQNIKGTNHLLKHGADVNCINSIGMTPLMYIVSIGNLGIVQNLLDKGAKETINVVNKYKRSALVFAVFKNVLDVVKELINAGAKTNLCDIFHTSPLMYACKNISSDVAKHLIKLKDESWHKDLEFLMCIGSAVRNNDTQTVEYLLNMKNKEKLSSEVQPTLQNFGGRLMIVAATNRNKRMLQLLLDAGANVNSVDQFLQSVLSTIIVQNDDIISKLLVTTYNADVDLQDEIGNTPLHVAIALKNKTMVDFLLQKKASRHLTNVQGVSAIMSAALVGQSEIVKALYIQEYDLELSDIDGWTPLMFACLSGDYKTAKFLIERGANTNVCSQANATPLIIASNHGKEDVVTLLLDNGASVSARDIFGQTALIHAAQNGHTKVVEMLLKKDADVDAADVFSKTAIMHSVQRRCKDIITLLLKHNANCYQEDVYGTTPLMIAAFSGYTELVQILLELKVPINDSNFNGNTALHFSCCNGHVQVTSLLLQFGANTQVTNGNGHTPLMLAAAKGHDTVVEKLLKHSTDDKDVANPVDGTTALMIAAQLNKLSTVKLLVQDGANVNVRSKSGDSALHLSVINGCKDVVKFLSSLPSVNLNDANCKRLTPLFLSILCQKFDILKQLIKSGADLWKVDDVGTNAIFLSLRDKSCTALKTILQYYRLLLEEKNTLLLIAKDAKCSAEVIALIDSVQPMETKRNTETKEVAENLSKVAPTDTSVSSGSYMSSETVISPEVVTKILEANKKTAETLNLELHDKNVNFSFTGDHVNVTINNNINVENMMKCNTAIGDKNTIFDDSRNTGEDRECRS